MPKLTAILGSPHKDGRCARMLECAAAAAKDAGWQVCTILLYDKQLSYCRGCRQCMRTGRCVQTDDGNEIAQLVSSSDAIALAAPTYWANVPGAVKNLLDRLLSVAVTDSAHGPKPKFSADRQYLLLTACNAPFPFCTLMGQSSGALRAMDVFFKASGMKRMGRLAWAGPDKAGPVPARLAGKIAGYWK